MFEEKESIWKKKGFYVSVCTAVICLLAIGTVYYRMNLPEEEGSLWAAKEATSSPGAAIPSDAAGDGTKDTAAVEKSLDQSLDESKKKKDPTGKNIENTASQEKNSAKAEQNIGEKEKMPTASPNTQKKAKKSQKTGSNAAKETMASQLSFQEEKGLLWPVSGDVLMKYDMTGTTYFKTLAQYRSNPALVISAKEGTKVKAAAAGEVLSVKKKDETGLTVTMNIGSQYTLVYGQLKDVKVKAGDRVKAGETFASIATPSQYYTEEGANLYFQVKEKKETVDPLLLLE